MTLTAAVSLLAAIAGCEMTKSGDKPMPTVAHVELQRFMGDWYVIANIPTRIERDAHNAVESYRLDEDGRIRTTFTFRKGSFDGPLKTYEPVGTVRNTTTNAEWGMQFIWPIKADYRIVYLDPEYTTTVVARQKRDYLWIMARSPQLPEPRYRELLAVAERLGYDLSKVQKVPQQPQESRAK